MTEDDRGSECRWNGEYPSLILKRTRVDSGFDEIEVDYTVGIII
jgi:hypothetical protein